MENKLTKDEKKAQRQEEWKEQLQKEERKKLFTKAAWIVGAIVVIVISFWGIITFTGSTQATPQLITKIPPITSKDLQVGPSDSKATLVEYADFQCPGCGAYHPLVKQLLKDFNGKIHFVYRTFPLTQIHQNAMSSSLAAIAANKQGKFWEMHDMLFEHQAEWSTLPNPQATFDTYGEKIGLDIAQFHKDIADPTVKKFITQEQQGGLDSGVNSTPTFILNGKQIVNPQTYDAFKQLIQDTLNQ